MRNIKYILVNDSMPKSNGGKSSNICIDNLGHHYVINSAGAVLNPIDVCEPGHLELGTWNLEPREVERLNACSIGIKYNGKLSDPRLRPLLIKLLVVLRHRYPDATILAKEEYDMYHTKVRDDMNQLRHVLSDLP